MDLLIHIKHNLLISNNLDQIWFWKKIPITFSQGCTSICCCPRPAHREQGICPRPWSDQYITFIFITINTLGPRQHRRRFADDIFKCVFLHSGRCPECICNRPRPWRRPCVSDWGCGAVILLSRGEFGREKNKICYQRGCVWTFCYMPNLWYNIVILQHIFILRNNRCASAASIMRPLSRGRPRDNSAVHGASEDVPDMTYDVPGVSYPIPWTSGDCPQGVRPADGPGTHSLASTGPFSQAAVHRASGLLRFSQSQRGRIMDRKWGCPQYVRNRKLMSRSCPGNATATLLAALTFFVKNKLILL